MAIFHALFTHCWIFSWSTSNSGGMNIESTNFTALVTNSCLVMISAFVGVYLKTSACSKICMTVLEYGNNCSIYKNVFFFRLPFQERCFYMLLPLYLFVNDEFLPEALYIYENDRY